ncbi:MAG: TauD/TfdA family dioxygenase [Pseudomonadales bacterium]|nr:TauD/TfdA family dioxygenase [Pseudomonadales bacterium]
MNTLAFLNIPGQLQQADGSVFPLVLDHEHTQAGRTELDTWLRSQREGIAAALAESGAILFRGFPLDSAEDFDAFSAAFGYPDFTYQESLSNAVRINFTPRVFTANEAPPQVNIYLHHEMAQTPVSPSKLFFFCRRAAAQGGETPLCRSDLLFAHIKQEMPAVAQEFKTKGVRYRSRMPALDDPLSGQGRSWRSTLSVNDTEAAEAKLRQLGYDWEWLSDGSLIARTPVLPAVRTLSDGSESFYNQLIAAYLGWPGVKESPEKFISFGDDTPISPAILHQIAHMAEAFTFDLPWQDGDVALVDNYRVMHGRRAYAGDRKREVLVTLVAGASENNGKPSY